VLATIVTRGRHVRHQKRHSGHDDIPAQCRAVHEVSQKDEKPPVRTMNGRAKALVQDAEAYRRPLDIAAAIPWTVRSRGSMALQKLCMVALIPALLRKKLGAFPF
jgi:hypothetical protein